MFWTDHYIGKPWRATPTPPESFTCGELCRYVLRERCGIDAPEIVVNANRMRDCMRGMETPGHYGLVPLAAGEPPRDYDIVYMARTNRPHHVGLAVKTADGLMILHCQEIIGVSLDSLSGLAGMQYMRSFYWYRHETLAREAVCP